MTRGWPRIAVVGAGAVGAYFGAMLARAGAPVTLIGRAAHVDAMVRDGLLLDGVRVHERVHVQASTEIETARGADLVLVCVKTYDTENIALALRPLLGAEATVVSLQNGVDNVQRMRRAAQIDALAAVVYVAVAMAGPGHVRHTARGDLIIGELAGRSGDKPPRDLDALARLFEAAQIPCRVSADVRTELWTKMTLNCAYNAISALGRARYGRLLGAPGIRELMSKVVAETVAVAHAEGVSLSAAEMTSSAWKLGEAMADATSSTAQDIARGKNTEIDSLNGYVARRGAALGIDTTANQALYALVSLLQEA